MNSLFRSSCAATLAPLSCLSRHVRSKDVLNSECPGAGWFHGRDFHSPRGDDEGKNERVSAGGRTLCFCRTAAVGGFRLGEISDINNNGADLYFEVLNAMVLDSIDIDVAFMLTGPPAQAGFAEVLCMGGVSRGTKPTFSDPPAAYINLPPSPNFARLAVHNPNNLSNGVGGVVSGLFYTVILKTWVPVDGTASSTYRHVVVSPGLVLSKGDFLVFHVDHAGVGGDVEMQTSFQYTLS